MSDFLLCTNRTIARSAANWLCDFTQKSRESVKVIEGTWGCLVYTRALVDGFEAWETEDQVFLLVGASEISERLAAGSYQKSTSQFTEILARAVLGGTLDPMRDILQPFCLVQVDKASGEWTVTTDCMSFIPVYAADRNEGPVAVSSHSEVAIKSIQPVGPIELDEVSACDLIMHYTIAHPYTLYRDVRVLDPGTYHRFSNGHHTKEAYWLPYESYDKFSSLEDAADAADASITECVRRATSHGKPVSLLLSAGEDSRTLACIASQWCKPQCVSVAPFENRESSIARRVAEALGLPWTFVQLEALPFLTDIAKRSLVSGTNGVAAFAHFIGQNFASTNLASSIVLGGFKADTFLKAYKYPVKYSMRGIAFESFDSTVESKENGTSKYLNPEMVAEVKSRREHHLSWLRELRPKSYYGWKNFWPLTQDQELPYYTSNRRLFWPVEPFMSPGVAQVAASSPVEWLLNRRLFHAAMKKHLRKLWWIPHGDGRHPAFGWLPNLILQPTHKIKGRLMNVIVNAPSLHAKAWHSPTELASRPEFRKAFLEYQAGVNSVSLWFPRFEDLVRDKHLGGEPKCSAVQIAAVVQCLNGN